ncbi:MAG TPA: hypothetical protein VMB82_07980 [Acidimicrobiales bacterium]|nr:hypothetical protein [Acidimicrobiales bacterium]
MSGPAFNDRADFDDADRGLIGSLEPCVIGADDGREIGNNDPWGFLDGAFESWWARDFFTMSAR